MEIKYKFNHKYLLNYINRTRYYKYYYNEKIIKKSILLEASHGNDIQGNIFYILNELIHNVLYKDYRLYLAVEKKAFKSIRLKLDDETLKRVNVVYIKSNNYYKIMASVEFLINDTSFMPFYIKKSGQKYMNVWHGTPLKTLGKRVVEEPNRIGNIQRNFIMADCILCPNEYTMNHLVEDYMLSNISGAKILLNGYPRNCAFFNDKRKKEILSEEGLHDKKVYFYMPTWRGLITETDVQESRILQNYLDELEESLFDDEVLYVKLHILSRKAINLDQYKKIKFIPDKYECYEFLNIADALITDYSSVMYDFAITGKNIVLFPYDKEHYLKTRGVYESLQNLPFDEVFNIEDLLSSLRNIRCCEYKDFIDKYCNYEKSTATIDLCKYFILNQKNVVKELEIPSNNKKNILIYPGNLSKNGITTSIFNLLSELDTSKYNYYLTFYGSIVEENKHILHKLPEGVNYIVCQGKMNVNFMQKIATVLYKKERIPFKRFWKLCETAYDLELVRCYGNNSFSRVIQFSGYDYRQILLFSRFKCKRIIFAHNDMVQEIETKGNSRREILEYAYQNYDVVSIVTEDIRKPIETLGKGRSHICVARNIITYKNILEKAEHRLEFDLNTESNVQINELKKILDSNAKIFINVGRYSPEKGHERLINAFNDIWLKDPNTYLIIIGGYDNNGLRKKLLEKVEHLACKNNVVLILSMSNPFPLIKQCNYFVLSSFYEGFGLVIAEANILGLSVISTDIPGPKTFMEAHNGVLVEDSEKGLYLGMEKMLSGEIGVMDVDYEKYNQEAVDEFVSLIF